jgi:hypothetical protein
MRTLLIALVIAALKGPLYAAPAPAQAPATAPKPAAPKPATPKSSAPKAFTQVRQPGDVETDPIRCFWKTDRSAIIVGERFTVVLTCGIIDTDRIKAVPDFNQLEGSTIGLQPFEVIKGVRHEDIKAAPWRYIQYEYTVRTIAEGLFDKDINLPGVKLTYHIQSSIGGGSTGRDQQYQLPPIAMHVSSTVPQKVTDIRDTAMNTFADIENRRVRATGEYVAAMIAFGFAVVLLGLAIVRVVSRYRVRTPASERPLGVGAVLSGCLREAGRVESEAAGGWTPELLTRALAVLRIGGAVALGRPVAQSIVATHVPAREGQIALRKGFLKPKRSLVSNATTPGTIARSMAAASGRGLNARTEAILKDLEDSLAVISAARYSRNGKAESSAITTAFENGVNAIRKLRSANMWPRRTVRSLTNQAMEIGWSR